MLVLACVLAASGCGTGESGPSVSGVLFGEAFVARHAAFDTLEYDAILIDISDTDGICSAGRPNSNLRFVGICLCTPGHDWVGDYLLAPGGGCPSSCTENVARAWGARVFAGSGDGVGIDADGGTVSVTAFSEQRAEGSIDVVFGGETVAGPFTASFCADLND